MRAALHATVHGRVQGVGFRWFVQRQANALKLTGGVRNLRNGTVEVHAEGPRAELEALLGALAEGPPGAGVERVEPAWYQPANAYTEFTIWPSR